MGVEYDLISDSAREGYELGKGPWYEGGDFTKALRSANPVEAVTAFIVAEYPEWSAEYAGEIARAVATFAAAHPDWRIIDDFSSDIFVATDVEREEVRHARLGLNPDDFPVYRRVGTRYRR